MKKPFQLLVYVEGCSQKMKKFKDLRSMNKFIDKFTSDSEDNPDNWIDFFVTDVNGSIIQIQRDYE